MHGSSFLAVRTRSRAFEPEKPGMNTARQAATKSHRAEGAGGTLESTAEPRRAQRFRSLSLLRGSAVHSPCPKFARRTQICRDSSTNKHELQMRDSSSLALIH